MSKMQCLYYALDKWNEKGGYLVFRKSTHWCVPHVLHLDENTNELTHYVPPENLKYPWYSMFGFEGYIKSGDSEPCAPVPPICMGFGTIALFIFGIFWYLNRVAIRKNRRYNERRTTPRPGSVDRRRLAV